MNVLSLNSLIWIFIIHLFVHIYQKKIIAAEIAGVNRPLENHFRLECNKYKIYWMHSKLNLPDSSSDRASIESNRSGNSSNSNLDSLRFISKESFPESVLAEASHRYHVLTIICKIIKFIYWYFILLVCLKITLCTCVLTFNVS